MRIPCGRVLGHGDSCVEGHLCDSCQELLIIRSETLEAAAKIADARGDAQADCDRLGPMDPETGVRECSLEPRGGCLCAERIEEAEEIAKRIRALKATRS